MSAQDNVTIAKTIYDSFNHREFDQVAALVAEDAEVVNIPVGEVLRGPEGLRQDFQAWATAFEDAEVEITNLIPAGEWVVVEFTGRGTNTGPLAGPAGELPATGRRVELRFCDVLQIQDGKIVVSRSYYDMASLLHQLGALPTPAASQARSATA